MLLPCPKCKKEIDSEAKFCQFCGYKIVAESAVLSTAQKIKIYFLSVVLTPLGLYWFFKYLRNPNLQNRMVGYIALVLTLVSLVVTIIVTSSYISSLNTYINNYGSELGL